MAQEKLGNLIVNITEKQFVRLQNALSRSGHAFEDELPTEKEVVEFIKEQLKSLVIGYETGVEAQKCRSKIQKENW